MKRAIVIALEWLCGVLDNTPWIIRTDESWLSLRLRRHSCIGCYPLGLATLSMNLDDKWRTGVWREAA